MWVWEKEGRGDRKQAKTIKKETHRIALINGFLIFIFPLPGERLKVKGERIKDKGKRAG